MKKLRTGLIFLVLIIIVLSSVNMVTAVDFTQRVDAAGRGGKVRFRCRRK
ncbi:MAG: hypothetical protein JJT76_00555 [Clostridiaceae bacterium]|nr:hypothetical protein [Clostridiaceae bacterium]